MSWNSEKISLNKHRNAKVGIVKVLDRIHTEGHPGATTDEVVEGIEVDTGWRTGRSMITDEMKILQREGKVKKTGVEQASGKVHIIYSLDMVISNPSAG